ncbi:calcium/sodium antiporter [Micropruina sp.]|uniref:calcium/sodium antiporter n=1 Tax=Micropruina sp. TaxID=2737536 RepID=UPI002616E3CD|nr:calcium/sodium antiporter [Micropruina sp.]
MVPVLLVIGGLVALIAGAELVVRYGSLLARRLGIPPMIIGLTVVSIGTSAPELAVGIDAMKVNAGSLAVGNIAGTNIVNLLLILGLSAALRPIDFERRTLVLDLPGMAIVAVLVYVFSLDGALQTWEGVPLVIAAVAYTVALGWWTRRENAGRSDGLAADLAVEARISAPTEHARARVLWFALLLVVGIAIIVIGADWLVRGSEELARLFGVSDAFIGLTVVAIGTSAPELVTALVSTVRGDRDIAVGNLIGSSVYNLTLILGVPVLVANGSGPIDTDLLHIDLPIMVAVCLLCVPLFLTGKRLSRAEGVWMVAGYVAYFSYLLLART